MTGQEVTAYYLSLIYVTQIDQKWSSRKIRLTVVLGKAFENFQLDIIPGESGRYVQIIMKFALQVKCQYMVSIGIDFCYPPQK